MTMKTIKDYPMYAITPTGKVFSHYSDRFLKPVIQRYARVNLVNDDTTLQIDVHRLVAQTFLEKPNESNLQVNHIDGNKLNNDVSNLEWITAKGNINHALKLGLRKRTGYVQKQGKRYYAKINFNRITYRKSFKSEGDARFWLCLLKRRLERLTW